MTRLSIDNSITKQQILNLNLIAREEARNRSFAWKVRCRIKHDRNPRFPQLQDKYEVKEFARAHGISSAKVLYLTDRPESIPFDELPANYFIKATHGCTWNVISIDSKLYYLNKNGEGFVRQDGTLASGQYLEQYRLSRAECIALCKQWLRSCYRPQEWAYTMISPRIMVEEKITQGARSLPREYKLFTMDGSVKAIAAVGAIFRANGFDRLFFDTNWQPFPMTRQKRAVVPDHLSARPAGLDEMIGAAECLGKGLDFIRVDMFQSRDGVFLGEMTVYPFAGMPGTPSSCPEFNKWLGAQWTLPEQVKRKMYRYV